MVGVKDGPKLIIDYVTMYQLMQMPEFWAAMPPLLVDDIVADEVPGALKRALKIAMGEACAGCTSLRGAVLPIHNKVWQRLHGAVTVSPAGTTLVDTLVGMIASKRGYRPKPITVYYKNEAGEPFKFEF